MSIQKIDVRVIYSILLKRQIAFPTAEMKLRGFLSLQNDSAWGRASILCLYASESLSRIHSMSVSVQDFE